MSKKGVSVITGNTTPIVGEKSIYQVASWYPATLATERDLSQVTWELFKKRRNGKFTTTHIKKKGVSEFTFGEAAVGATYRLEGYRYAPEGGGLIITPKRDSTMRINKVQLFYVDDTPGEVFSFHEKLRVRAYCSNMLNKRLKFILWEDDVNGPGHDGGNKLIDTKTGTVDANGVATVEFMLTRALMEKAKSGEADIKQLEFYVTVEYYVRKKHATDNVHINNPFPQAPPPPRPPQRNLPPSAPPRAPGSPAGQRPPSQREERGILDRATDAIQEGWDELWDWWESQGTAQREQPPTLPEKDGVSPTKVGTASSSETTTCVCKEYNLIWGGHANMTCEKRKKVVEVCKNIWGEAQKIEKANMLMAVMHLETDNTFDSSKKGVTKSGTKYVGLVQFSSTTASSLGTSYEALGKMTFVQQMDYVEKYLKQNKDKMKTLEDFYLQVLKPSAVGNGDNPDYVIFDESISVPDGDGRSTSQEQRNRNITAEPWVTKYGYASNPLFMKEENEKIKRRKWVYTRQRYEERYGFVNGKTSVWEITKEIKPVHYDAGQGVKFSGKCENIKEEKKKSSGRAPWVDVAFSEFEKFKGKREKDSPLKERIAEYFKGTGNPDLNHTSAWCAAFVRWCFDHTNDYKDINTKGTAAAYDWAGYGNSKVVNNKYVDGWKEGEKCDPFVGAIIVFSWSHTAIIVGQNMSGNKYVYLGGNQTGWEGKSSGTQVISLASIDKNSSQIFAIMKPKKYEISDNEKKLPNYDVETENDFKSTR